MIPSHEDYCFEYMKKVTFESLPLRKFFRYKQFILEKVDDSKVVQHFELVLDAGSYEFLLIDNGKELLGIDYSSVVEPGNIVFHDNYSTWEADVL